MIVGFPANCNSEASRWSFCVKLNEKLRIWHNKECFGVATKDAEYWRKAFFYPKIKVVMAARNEQIETARAGIFWNPRTPEHVSGGAISYPALLNENNEGSRAVFLFGLIERLHGRAEDDADLLITQEALLQAEQDAVEGTFWNPKLEDIN